MHFKVLLSEAQDKGDPYTNLSTFREKRTFYSIPKCCDFWHKILCATPFNVFCLFFSNSCPAIRILELFAKILRSAKICVSIYALICVHYPDMTLCVVDRNLSQSA